MFLDNKTFANVIDSTPLISIDLVVKNELEQALLGLRVNKPAQGCLFVPGGRIQKNELVASAFSRLCIEELGLVETIANANYLGNFEHFYADSVFGDNINTHYIVLAYEIQVEQERLRLPIKQHSDYVWLNIHELLYHPKVHQHSKWYFN